MRLIEEKEVASELCDNNANYDAYCRAIDIVKSGGVGQVTAESAEELEFCPFCGGTTEMKKGANHTVWHECMKCHVKITGDIVWIYLPEALRLLMQQRDRT